MRLPSKEEITLKFKYLHAIASILLVKNKNAGMTVSFNDEFKYYYIGIHKKVEHNKRESVEISLEKNTYGNNEFKCRYYRGFDEPQRFNELFIDLVIDWIRSKQCGGLLK